MESIKISIKVKTMDSIIKEVKVDPEIFVIDLKIKIEESLGIPVSKQRLVFKGKLLLDDKPIMFYDV